MTPNKSDRDFVSMGLLSQHTIVVLIADDGDCGMRDSKRQLCLGEGFLGGGDGRMGGMMLEVQFIFNIVLVSGVWHSESVIHTHTLHSVFFLDYFPIIGHYRILSNFSVIYSRSLLVVCFIHGSVCMLIVNF